MPGIATNLREKHIVGADTPERIIAPEVSPLMRTLNLGLAGVSDAGEGFEMVRLGPSYGHVLACWGGSGEVLIDGRWELCGAGMAYLTPPFVPHAYHTVPGTRWGFSWVWWHMPVSGTAPLIDCTEPVLVPADASDLRAAITGLYRESMGPAQPTVLDNWVELVHAYVVRLGRSQGGRRRGLASLWQQVDSNLAHPWTCDMLADSAGVSGETLRRLCQRESGRGPIHQLTVLRMRRAAMLLESSSMKIDAVARAVGYANPFAFSTAFKRQMGRSPAAYREFRRGERRPPNAVRCRAGHADPF